MGAGPSLQREEEKGPLRLNLGGCGIYDNPGRTPQVLNECMFLLSLLPSLFHWGPSPAPGQRQQSF